MKRDMPIYPIVISPNVLTRIAEYFKGQEKSRIGNAVAVYVFLYSIARQRGNVEVFANDSFIVNGTNIGHASLRVAKRALKKIGLIETVRRKEKGRFTDKAFTKVNFVWSEERIKPMMIFGDGENARYRLSRYLLIERFGEHTPIEACEEFSFTAPLNDTEVELTANVFYFEGGLLKCKAEIGGTGTEVGYTIPMTEVAEVIMALAECFSYTVDEVANATGLALKEA